MTLIFYILVALVVLQFSDALTKYKLYNETLTVASSEMQWLAGLIGIPAALITTKVVIVAVFVSLYVLTALPWWLWLLAAAYYLYSTGKGLVLWSTLVTEVDPPAPVPAPLTPSVTPSVVPVPDAVVPVVVPPAPVVTADPAPGTSS